MELHWFPQNGVLLLLWSGGLLAFRMESFGLLQNESLLATLECSSFATPGGEFYWPLGWGSLG